MRLASIEIRDFRSVFAEDGSRRFRLDLASGSNTLVGLNNCGKSNVLRAISLALDPHHPYDAEIDAPGPRRFASPEITLEFQRDEHDDPDGPAAKAFDAALRFEESTGVGPLSTLAIQGEIRLTVTFEPTSSDGVVRQERLATTGGGRHDQPHQRELERAAIASVRDAVRFVLISSGESIESVLEGNFREILHNVVRSRLSSEFAAAETTRTDYIAGLKDNLLEPLRDRLAHDVGAMFPEIGAISLLPQVSTIEHTLSNVGVALSDIVDTPLDRKGTGVRGGVLVAMLSYLALNADRAMVFALEEPEAFLHPAAQEDLRDQLHVLADVPGITLLVTTHSPFLVGRRSDDAVFVLDKDASGRTRVAKHAAGDTDHAPLVGGLLRETSFAELLTQSSAFPAGTKGVLLVEGDGDRFCLELVLSVVGRPDLLDGIAIRPTGGTIPMVAQAIITKAATPLPLLLLVDNDTPGRKVKNELAGQTFGFSKKQILRYCDVFGPAWEEKAVEAEDLFAPDLIQDFVDEHGPQIVDGSFKRPDDAFHYDFGQTAKIELAPWLTANTRPAHVRKWLELIVLVRQRLRLPIDGIEVDDLVSAADGPSSVANSMSRVLVVNGQHDLARFQQHGIVLVDDVSELGDDVTHVGFYTGGAIQPVVPAVRSVLRSLLLDPQTSRQLRETGGEADARVADFIDDAVLRDANLAGTAQHVVVLTPADDPITVVLDAPIKNTKQLRGRPVAWTTRPRAIAYRALARRPETTDELDALE